ncbi:MAG TPA: hypothetical protein VFN56_03150 [Candidatus Saccharimonadales bacterium]|nr:hypothetical protein [Candidatus Saccharimonadales bacterium]
MLGRKKDSKPALSPEQQLEQRVDAMMDPSQPDTPSVVPTSVPADAKTADGDLPPLDIFSDAKTAPDVPKQLLKQLGADAAQGVSTETAAPTSPADVKPQGDTAPQLDDNTSDAAVDDIVAAEGDTVLAAEDAVHAPLPPSTAPERRHRTRLYKKWWLWVLMLIAGLAALAAVPYTRYRLAGLVLHRAYSVHVQDSSTHTPISDAVIHVGTAQATTNAAGVATVEVPVGPQKLTVTKQYYRDFSQTVTVPLSSHVTAYTVMLAATGRQVPVHVVDAVTGAPVASAVISVLNTTARTNAAGTAILVLPASAASDQATVTADGYNPASAGIQVTNQVVAANTVKLVPSGQVYFLSNASGKIDVVKANLDGSNRHTVLAGNGNEDVNNTVLLASADWKYAALLSKRSGGQYPELYLITTAADAVTTIDQGSFNFSPIGWSGHTFVYRADNPANNSWQPGGTVIKSYDAESGKTTTLASTNATGSSNADAQYENIWDVVLMGDKLVYDKTWYSYPGNLSVTGQQNTLNWVATDGSNAKILKSLDSGSAYFSNLKVVTPTEVDLGVYSTSSANTTYYRLDTNGNVTQSNTITQATITQPTINYLPSPSGAHQFWGEIRDGKHTLFVGDQAANNPVTIASSSDYAPYGWYGDKYLLVSKNGSELYVMAADGSGQPLKISDYYKTAQQYPGYGGSN